MAILLKKLGSAQCCSDKWRQIKFQHPTLHTFWIKDLSTVQILLYSRTYVLCSIFLSKIKIATFHDFVLIPPWFHKFTAVQCSMFDQWVSKYIINPFLQQINSIHLLQIRDINISIDIVDCVEEYFPCSRYQSSIFNWSEFIRTRSSGLR